MEEGRGGDECRLPKRPVPARPVQGVRGEVWCEKRAGDPSAITRRPLSTAAQLTAMSETFCPVSVRAVPVARGSMVSFSSTMNA